MPEVTLRIDLPASHQYLNVLGAFISEMLTRVDGLADPASQAYNLQLAVHEVCTNIVDHAYEGMTPGRIALAFTLKTAPNRVLVDVHDTGQAFDPSAIPTPNLEVPQEHGYGLFLIHQLMDEVKYVSGADGNHWYLVKHL